MNGRSLKYNVLLYKHVLGFRKTTTIYNMTNLPSMGKYGIQYDKYAQFLLPTQYRNSMQTWSAPSEQNAALKIWPTWKDLRGHETRAPHTVLSDAAPHTVLSDAAPHTALSEAECRRVRMRHQAGTHTVTSKTLTSDNSGKERLNQTYPLAHTWNCLLPLYAHVSEYRLEDREAVKDCDADFIEWLLGSHWKSWKTKKSWNTF